MPKMLAEMEDVTETKCIRPVEEEVEEEEVKDVKEEKEEEVVVMEFRSDELTLAFSSWAKASLSVSRRRASRSSSSDKSDEGCE